MPTTMVVNWREVAGERLGVQFGDVEAHAREPQTDAVGTCADITDARALRQLEVEGQHVQRFRAGDV